MNTLVNLSAGSKRAVKELVVVSGKGGTGKTSLTASLAMLATNVVVADCDVDAANLHLLAVPRIERREPFTGGKQASIDASLCIGCGQCMALCRFGAIRMDVSPGGLVGYVVEESGCEGCGVCTWNCPVGAIEFAPVVNGEWYRSESRLGPMVHAKLRVLGENSGKLVSLVRSGARQLAEDRHIDLVIVDGAPGIGCPVIASVTGAGLVLVVTEPTPSGLHDMLRVAKLTRHFGVPTALCVNKWDLNPELCEEIERKALELGMTLAGRVHYDRSVIEAQVRGMVIVEHCQGEVVDEVRALWNVLCGLLNRSS